jgi:hypothetical protein
MNMRKLFFLALCVCTTIMTGGLLHAQDELKVKFSGYADYHGIYYDYPDTGYANYMEGRLRPYFNFAKGDVSADLKLELDPVMGVDTGATKQARWFDFGADQTGVIEVKNAYLQVKKVFNYVDFKGGVFGYTIPGSLTIDDDVPGFELAGQVGRFSIDATMLKYQEGDVGKGIDDIYYWNLWALTDGPVSANFIGAAAFGADKTGATDINYSAFGGKLESTITFKPAYVKFFGVFLSGDKNPADDKNKNFADTFLMPAPNITVTDYFYEGGLEGWNIGAGASGTGHATFYTSGYGVITLGGGIGKTFNNTTLEAIGAYHMAAAKPASGNSGYGFEANLNAKQKIAKNATLEGEFTVFVPGDYLATKKDTALEVVVGPSFKW